ncbi:ESF1-like [Silurus meridionalis]|nr:ESF1-like [Silurus meridionalis]
MSYEKEPSADTRFARVKNDPRFWEMPDMEQKLRIDKRFQSMFHDKRFKLKYTVDKRGQDDDDDDDEEEHSNADKEVGLSSDDDDDDEEDDEEEESVSEEDSDSGPDLARGKGTIETSSEDEDDEDVAEDLLHHEEEEIEHDWGEMWKDAPANEEVSCRLAVCNMNSDRIKAKDLLALFSSFKPKGGVVLSVTIYPSEFGKERLKMEQTQGSLELTSLPDDPDADSEEQRSLSHTHTQHKNVNLSRPDLSFSSALCILIRAPNFRVQHRSGFTCRTSRTPTLLGHHKLF